MKDSHFVPVTDIVALDSLFQSSQDHPVIVFKHDPYCSISASAYRQMAQLPDEVALVDVAHDRDVARAIAERTGVRHESPQVMVLRDGEAVWDASHFRIKADEVSRIMQAGAPAAH